MVATCSYETRAFGVRSAMPSSQAMRLCPEAIFVPPRFEAYLNVAHSTACQCSATLMARYIKQRIWESTGLTAAAGVSHNTFLAKIASDRNKPNGLCCILPRDAAEVLSGMPIGRFRPHGDR